MLDLDGLIGIAGQAVQDLALRGQRPMQLDRRALDPEDRADDLGVSDARSLRSGCVDSLVELFDRRQRLIDGELEDAEEEVIGPVPQPVARIAPDVFSLSVENLQG